MNKIKAPQNNVFTLFTLNWQQRGTKFCLNYKYIQKHVALSGDGLHSCNAFVAAQSALQWRLIHPFTPQWGSLPPH